MCNELNEVCVNIELWKFYRPEMVKITIIWDDLPTIKSQYFYQVKKISYLTIIYYKKIALNLLR